MDEDLKYLKNLSKGNISGFDALFMRYYPKLKNFLKSFLKNEDEAKDIAQDIFLKIWSNRKSFSEIYNFKSYLFKMAKNAVYDYYNKNKVKEKYVTMTAFKISDFDNLSDDNLNAKDLEMLLRIAIEKMPEKRRKVFILSRQFGMSNDDIAIKLNISKRTVENHITTALSEVKSMFLEF